MTEQVKIEVVYALPLKQTQLTVKIEPGTSVEEALMQSGILRRHPELELASLKVGIFGRVVPMTTRLSGGERIEIYRPLIADPREMRRKRAEKAKKQSA